MRAIPRHPAFLISIAAMEVVSSWAFPGIQLPMVFEPHDPILLCPMMSMPRKQFQESGHAGQK
jgi:hypothetical protein